MSGSARDSLFIFFFDKCAVLMYRRELEVRGSYMCERGAYKTLIRLAESGLLQLEQLDIKKFPAGRCD